MREGSAELMVVNLKYRYIRGAPLETIDDHTISIPNNFQMTDVVDVKRKTLYAK